VGTGTPTTYAYDAVGNRTLQLTSSRVTYSYDAANQLVRSQSGATLTTYAYDNAGNRRLLQTTSRTTYVWDDENRMVTSQPAIATNYTYGPDNLRVTASNTNTRHVWDGQNAIEERDSSSNAIQVAYTLEPLLYGNLISQRRSGASSYYLFDALGNVVNLTDSGQNKPNSYTYPGAYGNFSLQISGTALNNNLIFVGRQGYYASNPPFNALYYIHNRWYEPSTAVWLSPDPIGFRGGDWNLYRYVRNNPVNAVDPSGQVAQVVAGALIGCAGGAAYSIGFSLWSGDSWCQCTCKAFASCGFGAVGGALAAANPAWGGCIVGATGAVLNNVVGNACNSLCGKPGDQSLLCAVVSALAQTLVGCGLGGIGTATEYGIAQAVSNLVGYDVNGLCEFFAPPAKK